MNTAELKLKIFREVDSLDKNKLEDAEWFNLTQKQREGILVAIESVKQGKGIPHEFVVAKYNQKYYQ